MTKKEERCLIRFEGKRAICRNIESEGKCQVRRKRR